LLGNIIPLNGPIVGHLLNNGAPIEVIQI